MYLSRVELSEHRRTTLKAMESPQVMHATVMSSFDSFGGGEDDRVLWRTDKVGEALYLLVQSSRKPDFSHIVDQLGRPATGQSWDTVEYDPFVERISEGDILRFRLRANPTHSVKCDGDRGKVYPHVTAEQQLGWLVQRSEANGFSVMGEDGTCRADIVQREIKRFMRDGKRMTLSVVTFEGVLEVKDAELFRNAMRTGIGRAKAYGCGLLTVARRG